MTRAAIAVLALALPTAAEAACTGDLPASGVLNVYPDAMSDSVIGGISANQCGLEVSDFCTGGRCLAFFDGLSGYIDVSALASGTIAPFPATFEYSVSAVDGSLSFMGRTQPFEMGGDDLIVITPAADHVRLSLPEPLPNDIRMTSTGSSGWEAILPNWVGVPIPVTVYLDRLSAPEVSLELFADHQMLKMDMRLRLTRKGALPDADAGMAVADPVPGETTVCDATFERAVAVGQTGDQAQIDAFYAAVAVAGITNWDARTQPQCIALLDELDKIAAPSGVQTDVAQQTCDALIVDLRPILRGPDSAEKTAVLSAMVALGVTSIDTTNPKHCAEISTALGR